MHQEIVLIGPMGAGKSTLGRSLSAALGIPQRSMDDLRWDYYKEIGYSENTQKQIQEAEGFAGVLRYGKPFEAHAVERLLSEHQDCVIDFGAGHSVYEDPLLFARVQKALLPFPNVFLVLPSSDLDESVRVLCERTHAPSGSDRAAIHEHFVKHRCNHDLAKKVVYTEGKTPEETRDEILSFVVRT